MIRKYWDHERINIQEQFVAFFFNHSKRFIGYKVITTGNSKACSVDIKLLCCLALKSMASCVIVAHNHPSGNLNPSKYDDMVSLKIQEALRLIDITLLDHFIIVEKGYFSLAESGWIS